MNAQIPEVGPTDVPTETPPGLVVLDVREDDEWEAGHIDGARHIPLMELPARFAEVPADQQILVVCKSGSRSAQATAFLQAQGVDAVNLSGGTSAWHAAGRPLVSESTAPPQVL